MSKTIKEFIKLFGPLALALCVAASWFLLTNTDVHWEIVTLASLIIILIAIVCWYLANSRACQFEAEEALLISEQRFKDVSEAVGEYIWETDAGGHFKFVTDETTSVFGYTPKELLGKTIYDFMPDEDIEDFRKWKDETYGKRESFTNIEIKNLTKDGQIIWMQVSGVPHFDDKGEFLGYRGAAMNITDRKEAEDALKASERRLRALAESAYDAIIMIDNSGRVSFWNHAAEQLFGYSEAEVMGNDVHALIAPQEDRDEAEKGLHEFAKNGTGPILGKTQETVGMHKDGTTFQIERSVSAFRLGEEWYAVATIRDITERKKTEDKLRQLATTDSLTGLYNRHRFIELSKREFARSRRYTRPLAMFMLDIDYFKKVNDAYGHDTGDKALRSLAETAIIALRNADILGRLGGEEFAVLLPETGQDAAMEVAERLRVSIERSIIVTNSHNLTITVSIGVACLDPETRTLEQLLKRADIALYEAKQLGRNRTILG